MQTSTLDNHNNHHDDEVPETEPLPKSKSKPTHPIVLDASTLNIDENIAFDRVIDALYLTDISYQIELSDDKKTRNLLVREEDVRKAERILAVLHTEIIPTAVDPIRDQTRACAKQATRGAEATMWQ